MGNPRTNIALSGQGSPTLGKRTDLIIGQLPFGNANAGKVFTNVQNLTVTELDTIFLANTSLRNSIKKYLKTNGYYSRLDVQTREADTGAVKASGSITFAGTATEDGTLLVSVVSEKDFTVELAITTGDNLDAVRTALTALLTAVIFPNMPVAVTDGITGVTGFEAIDGGSIGNGYGIKVVGAVAGITYTVTAMASGATDPTYVSTNIPTGQRYSGIMAPSWFASASVDALATALDAIFNSTNAIKDGVCFHGMYDTYANLLAFVTARNSKSLVVAGNKTAPATNPFANTLQTGGAIVHPIDWILSAFMGIRSLRLTEDAPIADYVIANGLDVFGGIALASMPYFNTPFASVPVTSAQILLTETEKLNLETAGFFVIDVNDAENGMLAGSAPTTYKTDALGNSDSTWKYLNYFDTGSAVREYIFSAIKADLAQMRLTNGELSPGRNIQNSGSIEALFMKYYAFLGEEVLVQTGGAIVSAVSDATVVTIDLAKRTVTLISQIPIVTQLGTINIAIKQVFTI